MSNNSLTPTFAGEIQLAGWSETHNGGAKVTFWLQSTEDLEPFRALTVRKGNTAGHRFMAAFVEIGEDEMPVQPPKPKVGALCVLAVQWCKDPQFRIWANVQDEESAKNFMLAICEIDSRKELDTNTRAAADFEARVRKPYMAYLKANV